MNCDKRDRSTRMSQLTGQRNGSANEFKFVMRTKRIMIMIWALCLASSGGSEATFTMGSPVLDDKLLIFRLICERRIYSLIATYVSEPSEMCWTISLKNVQFRLNHHPEAQF